jgi:predicted PurR-regulated permease PerM
MTDPSNDQLPPPAREIRGPHLWHIRWVRDLFFICLALFVLWFGYYLRGIFTPVLIGLFLAYLFHPIITWAERRHNMPRPATIGILLGLVLIVVGVLAVLLGPLLFSEVSDLIEKAPDYLKSLGTRLAERYDVDVQSIIVGLEQKVAELRADPAGSVSRLLTWAFAGSGAVAGFIESVVGMTFYVTLMLVLIPFYFFYFAWQFGPVSHAFDNYIPASQREEFYRLAGKMDRAIAAYFRDRLVIGLIMAVLFWLGWWIVGVPYAFLLGLAAGVLSLIPYVGIVVWPIALILMYLEMTTGADAPGFDAMAILVWPTLVYVVVQFLEGWILTPYIQGKSMEMSAVTILIVVFIGGAVGGMYGLILCIPIAACIKIFLQEYALPRLARWAAQA